MSTTAPNPQAADNSTIDAMLLVQIIELKWLLAGHGIRLHVERLQSDREYARQVLEQAAGTSSASLRAAAERLRGGLGLAGC